MIYSLFTKTSKMDFSISSSYPALDTVGRPENLDNPVQNWTSGRPKAKHYNQNVNKLRNNNVFESNLCTNFVLNIEMKF